MSERASLINDKIFIFKVDIEPNEILDNRLLYRVWPNKSLNRFLKKFYLII